MITRIESTRYRCLDKLDLDLPEYAVLVGANGAGKTTFLDIPGLFSDLLLSRNIGHAFTQEREYGLPPRTSALKELVFAGRGDDFILAVEARLPDSIVSQLLPSQTSTVQNDEAKWFRYIRYEIRLSIFNEQELQVSNEYCFLFSDNSLPKRDTSRLHGEFDQVSSRKRWRFLIDREGGGEISLRPDMQRAGKSKNTHADASTLALPRVQFESANDYPASRWLFDHLVAGAIFYEPNIEKLQVASPPALGEKLLPDASNLPHLAKALRDNEDTRERFDDWVEHVQTALPQVREIDVAIQEHDKAAFFVITYQGGHKVSSFGLSEGTLRILALTLIPYLKQAPALIITEEPENGIHPRAIESVLQSLGSAYDSQVLISSHSPVALAHSELDHLLCARVASTGAASIVSGNAHPRLKEWQGSIDLGALFATGVLG